MLAMWGYNTLSRNKTSSFDDIIATANQSEKKDLLYRKRSITLSYNLRSGRVYPNLC